MVRNREPVSLAAMLVKMAPEMSRALPKHLNADRMNRIVLTALRMNPKLAECSPASFFGCVLSAAQLGLEPNTPLGHAYLIPRKGEVTLQIGYQGMIQLARNSGELSSIYAEPVYPGDEFTVTLGLTRDIRHVPSDAPDRESRPLSHVYAVAKLKSGDVVFVVLTRAQVERYKSRGAGGPAWQTDFAAMATKTAIRRLFTWLPKSAEMAQAAALDEAPEIGKVQVWDSTVTAALEAHGMEAPEEFNAETGEVEA